MKSAQKTATFIGCNFRKVERIRKIRNKGTHEIQRAVRTDKMSINRAYTLLRKMEKAMENGGEDSSIAPVKPMKITFSRENFAFLQELDGDVGLHENNAIEMYMRWLRENDRAEPKSQGAT